MLIQFLCLCPLRLAIMLNFYTLKVAYWISTALLSRRSRVQTPDGPTLRVLK